MWIIAADSGDRRKSKATATTETDPRDCFGQRPRPAPIVRPAWPRNSAKSTSSTRATAKKGGHGVDGSRPACGRGPL